MADCTGEREKEGYSVEAAVRNRLSGLRLDSSSFKSSSAAEPKNPTKTLKRRSPTQPPPVSEPNPKKEKLSLPPPSPLLRRCISDTFCFNPTPPLPQSPPEPTVKVTPPPPPASTTYKPSAAASASIINLKPELRRSVSAPNPRSPKTISGSDEDEDEETPNSKRLARIKNQVREMSLWFQQVMLDEDHDDDDNEEQHHQEQDENGGTSPADQDVNHNTNSTSSAEDDWGRKFEESLRVERMEECQVIRFRCGCGVPYDFLLAGDKCYYKLM